MIVESPLKRQHNFYTGDVLLIAGKGHETYQIIDGIRYHFDDREEIRQYC